MLSLGPTNCFIVGFFDLVGLSRELRKLPTCQEVEQEGVDHLARLAYQILKFRDDFEKFKEGEERITQKWDTSYSNEEQASRLRLQGNEVKVYTFSDTVIAYSSLNDTEKKQVPLDSCSNILMKAAASQLFSLVRKIPVRGGIEIGLGAETGDREIFGSGIYEAYRLESKVADWPRILIGKQLRKYLSGVAGGSCHTDSDHMNQKHAQICLELLCLDPDDNAMLDLLSPHLAAIIGEEYQNYLTKARAFVASELTRFRKEGDTRLADRYEKFSAYLCNPRK